MALLVFIVPPMLPKDDRYVLPVPTHHSATSRADAQNDVFDDTVKWNITGGARVVMDVLRATVSVAATSASRKAVAGILPTFRW